MHTSLVKHPDVVFNLTLKKTTRVFYSPSVSKKPVYLYIYNSDLRFSTEDGRGRK